MVSKYPSVTASKKQEARQRAYNQKGKPPAANDNKIGPVQKVPIGKVARAMLKAPSPLRAWTIAGELVYDFFEWRFEQTMPDEGQFIWPYAHTQKTFNAGAWTVTRCNPSPGSEQFWWKAYGSSSPLCGFQYATHPDGDAWWSADGPPPGRTWHRSASYVRPNSGSVQPIVVQNHSRYSLQPGHSSNEPVYFPGTGTPVVPVPVEIPLAVPISIPARSPRPRPAERARPGEQPSSPDQPSENPESKPEKNPRPRPGGGVWVVPPVPVPFIRPTPLPLTVPAPVMPGSEVSFNDGALGVRRTKAYGKASPARGDSSPKGRRLEKKPNVQAVGGIVWTGLNTVTEAFDFITAMHDAIPIESGHRLSDKASKAQVLEYMMTNFEPWKHVDAAEGLENFLNQQVGDMVAAFGSNAIKRTQQQLGATGLDRAIREHGDNLTIARDLAEEKEGFDHAGQIFPTLDIDRESGIVSLIGPLGVFQVRFSRGRKK